MKKIVVISAHPDDETLGAGGTLMKHKANGDQLYWIIVTNISDINIYSEDRIKSRENEINYLASKVGFEKIFKLDYLTTSLSCSNINSLISDFSNIFKEIEPEYVYTVNRSDAHSDHRIIFQAVYSCTKSFRYPYIKRVLMYECISETEFAPPLHENVFIPNYYVDITNFIHEKLELMKIFESEIHPHPFPRSLDNIMALAHFRGASVGVKYAEAFQLLKFIDK